MYEDQTLSCEDCGKEFVFSVGEQEFYAEKGLVNVPKRCPDCRRAKKQQRNNRGGFGGGGNRSFGGGNRW